MMQQTVWVLLVYSAASKALKGIGAFVSEEAALEAARILDDAMPGAVQFAVQPCPLNEFPTEGKYAPSTDRIQ